jgi:ArsR family transcriptional regulator
MNLKTLRQILKACADDTRLRIINILKNKELIVKDMCAVLKVSQPMISKHLTRLRLLKIVIDRREGNLIYYSLNKKYGSAQAEVTDFLLSRFHNLPLFEKDKKAFEKLKRSFKRR